MFQFLKSSFTSVWDFTLGRNRKRCADDNMSVGDGIPEPKKPVISKRLETEANLVEDPVFIDLTRDEHQSKSQFDNSSFARRTFYHNSNVNHRMRPIIKSSRRSGSFSSKNSNESNDTGKDLSQKLYSSWCGKTNSSHDPMGKGDIEILSRNFSSHPSRSSYSLSSASFQHTPKKYSDRSSSNIRSNSNHKKHSTPHVRPGNDKMPAWMDAAENIRTRLNSSEQKKNNERLKPLENGDDDILVTRVEIGQKTCVPKSADFEKLMRQCRYVETDWLTSSKNRCKTVVEENFKKADALKTLVKECEEKRSIWDSYLSKRTLRYLRLTSYEPTPIPDIYVEPEISEEEEELPPVTKDMKLRVERALQAGRDTILSDKFRLQVTVAELNTLRPRQWLSDMVINFYMELIAERSTKKEGALKCHPMTTFFYPKLRQSGYGSVRRWTRRIDVFSFDLILVPIHLGQHWCFALIQVKDKKISYFDSMQSPNNECLSVLLQYLIEEMKDKKGESLDINSWSVENAKNIPVQKNGYDCGVFTCQFAEFLSRKAPLSFSQNDMPYFRDRMMFEILTQKMLT